MARISKYDNDKEHADEQKPIYAGQVNLACHGLRRVMDGETWH